MEKLENKKLKIIFTGTPDMALVCLSNLLEKKFDICAVVPPSKDHETFHYFKRYVKEKGLNFLEFENSPNDKGYIEELKALEADIGVVCSYNIKLTKDFLSTTKMGYLNCHPSLLPQYRGAMPYFHIVKNREDISGVTIHYMDEEFDTGDIVYQEKFEVLPWETMGTLFNRTTYMLSDGLIDTLKQIQEGKVLKRTKQPSGVFNTAPKTENSYKINWKKSIYEIDSLIRACNPFFGAYTAFRQVSTQIIKAHPIEIKHNFECGEITKSDENQTFVAAKDGFISLDVIKLSTWGVFTSRDFFFTFTPQIGEKME